MAHCYSGCCDEEGPVCGRCSCCCVEKSNDEIRQLRSIRAKWENERKILKESVHDGSVINLPFYGVAVVLKKNSNGWCEVLRSYDNKIIGCWDHLVGEVLK